MSAKQQKGSPEYFPKRQPNDGFIDWNMTALDIYNQIRSLSNPYPNARTLYKDETILINKASYIKNNYFNKPGYVIYVFPTNELLISTGKGTILIEDFYFENYTKKIKVVEGSFFHSSSIGNCKKYLKHFKKTFLVKK